MIKKAVIPAAGLGTRLLPATKEQPKEMLPVFAKSVNGNGVCLKPILQVVYEVMYNAGIKHFCFITGRTKRAIEDHFTVDSNFMEILKNSGKNEQLSELKNFYNMLENSSVFWINQHTPKGLGHAILKSKDFCVNEPFLVHLGDTIIHSEQNHLKRLINLHKTEKPEVSLILEKVDDPRKYGVVVGKNNNGIINVEKVIEKPENPPSNLVITGAYVFEPIIFKALEKVKPDKKGEIQLTDAIQLILEWGMDVKAIEISENEERIDIGNEESYKKALDKIL